MAGALSPRPRGRDRVIGHRGGRAGPGRAPGGGSGGGQVAASLRGWALGPHSYPWGRGLGLSARPGLGLGGGGSGVKGWEVTEVKEAAPGGRRWLPAAT